MKSYCQAFQILPSEFLTKTNPVMLVVYGEVFNIDSEDEEEIPQTKEDIKSTMQSIFGPIKM